MTALTQAKSCKKPRRRTPTPLKTFHRHDSGLWIRDDGKGDATSPNDLIGVPDENSKLVYVLADKQAFKILERGED